VSVGGSDGAAPMLGTVRVLDDAGLEPTSLALHEPTLDDVFLSLTGHAAEESGDGETPAGGRRARRARGRAQ